MMYMIRVEAKGAFSTHRGQIEHTEIAGREFGDWVKTHLGFGFALLKPVTADLSMRVKRLTTVVYPKDAGLMLLELDIHPGARVIECGSGSGALTTLLANFVRPDGRVYSYERRPEFSANARQNMRRYGLEAYCEFFVRDPEQEGFAQQDVDAVLLDVPEPWTLVAPAWRALRGGNALAAIIPTFEQLRKLVSALQMQGFARIRCRETLERAMLLRDTGIRPADRMVAHTVYVITAHKTNQPGSVNEAANPERAAEAESGPDEPADLRSD
jgi:tRNA (adenine57-N1/adenine58-N1)-methyltransferase